MDTGVWVPAPDRVESRPFAGMTAWGFRGNYGVGLLATYGWGNGLFSWRLLLVGYGDGGLGPRFRGDDGLGLSRG